MPFPPLNDWRKANAVMFNGVAASVEAVLESVSKAGLSQSLLTASVVENLTTTE